MDEPTKKSEVARLQRQIALAYEAAQRGLCGLNQVVNDLPSEQTWPANVEHCPQS